MERFVALDLVIFAEIIDKTLCLIFLTNSYTKSLKKTQNCLKKKSA